MRVFDAPLINDICVNGIVSFELAKNIHRSELILNSWNNVVKISAYKSLYFDFFFILVYVSFILLLIKNTKYKYKKFFSYSIVFAGFFDIIENIALLNLLRGNLNQLWSLMAFYLASAKFTILFICLVYILVNGFCLIKKLI